MVICLEFSVCNCKIKIDFLFIAILSFAFLFDYKTGIYILLFAIIHEFAHLVTLLLVGGKPKKINVSIFGFGLVYDDNLYPTKELLFYLAGIIVNGILAIVFIILGKNDLSYINFMLFAINALPIMPLDGGRALRVVLWKIFSYNVSIKVFVTISVVFYSALLLLSIYLLFSRGIFSLLIIAIYVGLYMINNSF